MNKEQQDLAWSCLPKEARENISYSYKNSPCGSWVENLFEEIYGEHNLTSDTELDEMLMVKRKEVQWRYAINNYVLANDPNNELSLFARGLLTVLFGDKCLPYKEVEQSNLCDTCSNELKDSCDCSYFASCDIKSCSDYKPKEQPKPKFKVGDRVFAKNSNQVLTIEGIRYDSQKYDCGGFGFVPWDSPILEPYTKENKENFVKLADEPESTDKGVQTSATTIEAIGEKELNLCELLKGHEGETFYSPVFGYLFFNKINDNFLYFTCNGVIEVIINPNGKYVDSADELAIYPSKDQRDWNKWDKENNHKTPKTWGDIKDCINYYQLNLCSEFRDKLDKSISAFFKIYKLIEVGYGGNVSYEQCSELQYDNVYKIAPIGCKNKVDFHIVEVEGESDMNHIMFHTKEQAEEFLSYPENVQLLKEYYMIY